MGLASGLVKRLEGKHDRRSDEGRALRALREIRVRAAPVLGGVALAIRATMGRPVIFRQTRPGRGGQPFTLYKLRTMRAPRPGEEGLDADAQRLTRLGQLLRATSLDELPTLYTDR